MTEEIQDRLDRLETLVERQAETIECLRETVETQRERIATLDTDSDADAGTGADSDPDGEGDRTRDATAEGNADGVSEWHTAGGEDPPVTRRSALKAGGLLGLLGLGAGTAAADPQGKIGTADDPLRAVYTERLRGGITTDGDGTETKISSLVGENLSIDGSGALTADDTHVGVSNSGRTVVGDIANLNMGSGLFASDDGDGSVTMNVSVGDTTNSDTDTHTDVSDGGTTVVENTGDINFGGSLTVTDEGDGTATVDTTKSAATVQADYVTLSTDDDLDNERTLSGGDVISVTDNGAGSSVDVTVDNGSIGSDELANDSVTVAGNTVSLGSSTDVEYVDLSDTATSFPIPAGDLATPFADLSVLFGSPVTAGVNLDLGGNTVTKAGTVSGDNLAVESANDLTLMPNNNSDGTGCCVRVESNNNDTILEVRENGEVKAPRLDDGGGNAARPLAIESADGELVRNVDIDLDGNSLTDTAGTLTVESSSGNALTLNTDGGSRALELGPPGSNGSYTTGANFVAGYTGNSVNNSAVGVVIGGGGQSRSGFSNTAGANFATVGGGQGNTANGPSATVAGGDSNKATDTDAFVGGGFGNVAGNNDATVPGGSNNRADGIVSFAAGREAKADHTGSFVWADSSYDSFKSGDAGTGSSPTGGDTFHVLSTGGVRFVTGRNTSNEPKAGAYLSSGGSSWQAVSARSTKHDIEPVDPQSVLAALDDVEVSTWAYDSNPDAQHMGPMAGDFHDAFDLGDDPETIGHVDADGVAFAAIQGLSKRLDAKDDRIEDLESETETLCEETDDLRAETDQLRAENEQLRERNAELESRLDRIETHVGLDGSDGRGVADD